MKRRRAWWLFGPLAAALVGTHAAGCNTGIAGEGPTVDAETPFDQTTPGIDAAQNDATEDVDATSIEESGTDASDAIAMPGDGAETEAAPADAGSDSSNPCNETTCGGACCGSQCIPRTCTACGAVNVFCPYQPGAGLNSNGICVSDCSACSTGTTECFSCGNGPAVGTCAPGPEQCPIGNGAGACACPSGNASDCPGPTQVCASAGSDSCLTCGSSGTDGLICNGGGTCNEQDASCQ